MKELVITRKKLINFELAAVAQTKIKAELIKDIKRIDNFRVMIKSDEIYIRDMCKTSWTKILIDGIDNNKKIIELDKESFIVLLDNSSDFLLLKFDLYDPLIIKYKTNFIISNIVFDRKNDTLCILYENNMYCEIKDNQRINTKYGIHDIKIITDHNNEDKIFLIKNNSIIIKDESAESFNYTLIEKRELKLELEYDKITKSSINELDEFIKICKYLGVEQISILCTLINKLDIKMINKIYKNILKGFTIDFDINILNNLYNKFKDNYETQMNMLSDYTITIFKKSLSFLQDSSYDSIMKLSASSIAKLVKMNFSSAFHNLYMKISFDDTILTDDCFKGDNYELNILLNLIKRDPNIAADPINILYIDSFKNNKTNDKIYEHIKNKLFIDTEYAFDPNLIMYILKSSNKEKYSFINIFMNRLNNKISINKQLVKSYIISNDEKPINALNKILSDNNVLQKNIIDDAQTFAAVVNNVMNISKTKNCNIDKMQNLLVNNEINITIIVTVLPIKNIDYFLENKKLSEHFNTIQMSVMNILEPSILETLCPFYKKLLKIFVLNESMFINNKINPITIRYILYSNFYGLQELEDKCIDNALLMVINKDVKKIDPMMLSMLMDNKNISSDLLMLLMLNKDVGKIDPMMLSMMMNNKNIDPMMLAMMTNNKNGIDPVVLMMMGDGNKIDPMVLMMMNKNGNITPDSSMNDTKKDKNSIPKENEFDININIKSCNIFHGAKYIYLILNSNQIFRYNVSEDKCGTIKEIKQSEGSTMGILKDVIKTNYNIKTLIQDIDFKYQTENKIDPMMLVMMNEIFSLYNKKEYSVI